jgi:hypothetical protein
MACAMCADLDSFLNCAEIAAVKLYFDIISSQASQVIDSLAPIHLFA